MEIKRGSFGLDFGVFKMQAEVSEEDRQCAWELYTEIVTRVAISGKAHDPDCRDFSGEVLAESLASLYTFLTELRGLMRRFPVGRLTRDRQHHLGVLINEVIVNVLRPFLEEWQADYRFWWETSADKALPPAERQKAYPRYAEFIEDWRNVRLLMRDLRRELVNSYQLIDVDDHMRLLDVNHTPSNP